MLRVPNQYQQNSKKTIVILLSWIDITNYKTKKLPNRYKDDINRFQLKYTNSNSFLLKYANNWLSLPEKYRNTVFCLFRIPENTRIEKNPHLDTFHAVHPWLFSGQNKNFFFVKSSNVPSNVSTKLLTIIFFFHEFHCRNACG